MQPVSYEEPVRSRKSENPVRNKTTTASTSAGTTTRLKWADSSKQHP